MVEAWLIEFAKGIGRLFLHPLFYYLFVLALLHGYFRMKRERRSFHIRVFDFFHEIRFLLPSGIVLGLIISLVTIGAGVVIPFKSIMIIGFVTFVLSLTGRVRWLSPAYIIGISFFAVIFLAKSELQNVGLPALSILLGMLVLAEGLLIYQKGHIGTSPEIIKSKRGLPIGAHISQKLWMLPIFLLVPGEAISTTFKWWPVFTVMGEAYSLFLVPFGVGFYQKVKSMLPVKSTQFVGKRVLALGTVVSLLAIASLWYPVLVFAAVAFALIGRELISLEHRIKDDSQAFFYTKKDKGLLILGVIPHSPADKMGLKVGEVITKVNSIQVNAVDEFYQSILKNRAYCKLEVADFHGEIRFVQRALYDGEHHELGILFVQGDRKTENRAG